MILQTFTVGSNGRHAAQSDRTSSARERPTVWARSVWQEASVAEGIKEISASSQKDSFFVS